MKWEELNTERYYNYINSIIDKRGKHAILEDYWEGHHIIPKCKGGEGDARKKSDNVVWLYAREHFVAHKILAEDNPNDYLLCMAYWQMCNMITKKQSRIIATPDEYEEARKLFSKATSEYNKRFTKENNSMYGKHHTEEAKKLMSINKKLSMTPEVCDKIRKAQQGGNNSLAKKVKCKETNEVFGCITDAYKKYGEKFGLSSSTFRRYIDQNKEICSLHFDYYIV